MENSTQPQGKGMAIAGFVISLVGIIFSGMISVMSAANGSAMLSIIWVVFCASSVILSAMAMKKLGATGGKKGLAIAGLVVGICATVWAIMCWMAVGQLMQMQGGLQDALDTLDKLKLN